MPPTQNFLGRAPGYDFLVLSRAPFISKWQTYANVGKCARFKFCYPSYLLLIHSIFFSFQEFWFLLISKLLYHAERNVLSSLGEVFVSIMFVFFNSFD